jgi:NADPH:quinone reductase-like Zn-dependent oxidoreductase
MYPDELSATEAAPMMCAGVTTYNALRNSGGCKIYNEHHHFEFTAARGVVLEYL